MTLPMVPALTWSCEKHSAAGNIFGGCIKCRLEEIADLRAKLEQAESKAEAWVDRFGRLSAQFMDCEARARRLEEALRQYAIGLDGHYVHCPGEKFHGRPEHDCLAIRACEEIRAALNPPSVTEQP